MTATARDLTWAALALPLSVAYIVVALPVGSIVGSAFGESAIVRLSVAAGVWPLAASLTTLALARLLLDGRAKPGLGRPLAFVILGSVASAACAALLVAWTEGHFGPTFDPEYVGPTLWLPVLAGVVTVGGTWMLGLTAKPAGLGILGVAAASALIAVLALQNLPGLFDGVTAKGIPLMLAFASAGGVVLVGLACALRVSAPAGRGGSVRGGTVRGGPRGE
jgi:hypothetical protein